MTEDNLGELGLELIDPTPNIQALFSLFDKRYFWSSLSGVVVKWSKGMYSSAGVTRYRYEYGKVICVIGLSEPLLKLRPRKDMIETLLHEMIHAYLRITDDVTGCDSHGPKFCKHMNRINKEGNINIDIYHDFRNEVKYNQAHWWRCNGPCTRRHPCFGIVRRAIDRAPGPHDSWWIDHQTICGGDFIKIKEPENFKARPSDIDSDNMNGVNVTSTTNVKPSNITETAPTDVQPVNGCVIGSIYNYFTPKTTGFLKDVEPKNRNMLGSLVNYILPKSNQDANDDETVVRNHWTNKYLNSESPPDTNSVLNPDEAEKQPSLSLASDTIETYVPTSSIGIESSNKVPVDIDASTVINDGEAIQPAAKKIKIDTTSNTNEEVEKIPIANETVDLPSVDNDNKNCPVCNEPTNSIEEHLEDCISSFDQSIPDEGASDSQYFDADDEVEFRTFNETGTKHPCPVCYTMIERDAMNAHLDECLNQRVISS